MRQRAAVVIAGPVLLSLLVGGCSGVSTSSVPSQPVTLQSVADDHLSALLTVKRLFSIFYPRSSGTGNGEDYWEALPSLPDDPSGTERWRHTLADATEEDWLLYPTGRAEGVVRTPDGHESSWKSGPYETHGYWSIRHVEAEWWDGTHVVQDFKSRRALGESLDLVDGTATFSDRGAMTFHCEQGDHKDTYTLGLSDQSTLSLTVPLFRWWEGTGACQLLYAAGASGVFTNSSGSALDFTILGRRESDCWERWQLTAPGDLTGEFTVGLDLDGQGALRRSGEPVAGFRWASSADGLLEPVDAANMDASPSAAARNCAFDRWLAHVAALGPKPAF